jgi:hypothetical protein
LTVFAKAVAISHYAVIANVVQTLGHHGVVDPGIKENLFAPGDVAIGGKHIKSKSFILLK